MERRDVVDLLDERGGDRFVVEGGQLVDRSDRCHAATLRRRTRRVATSCGCWAGIVADPVLGGCAAPKGRRRGGAAPTVAPVGESEYLLTNTAAETVDRFDALEE